MTAPVLGSDYAIDVVRSILRADTALVAALDVGSTGKIKIRKRQSVPSWILPFVIINALSGFTPFRGPNGRERWSPGLVQVALFYDDTVSDELRYSIIGMINADLDKMRGDVNGGHVSYCLRQNDLTIQQTQDKATVFGQNIIYKLLVQAVVS